MSTEKTEGAKQDCGKCSTALICVKIIDNYEGRNTEKLQWQNVLDKKPHYIYAGPKKWNCKIPQTEEEQIVAEADQDIKPVTNITRKVTGPFDEAELITRWASEKAYKITMADVENANQLSPQEKSALGQKQGMLTRLLADTTLQLMKMHNLKTSYE